jgi:hypothetical protein
VSRVDEEVDLLRKYCKDLEYRREGQWVLLPRYTVPEEGGWNEAIVAVGFQFLPGYPAQKPYGFYVTPSMTLKSGATVQNATASIEPPWPGPWMKFSWDPTEWAPTQDLRIGSNMLNYTLTFVDRLKEGA